MITYKVIPRKNPQTGEFMYYGSVLLDSSVDLETIANEIAKQNTLTPTDVTAVLVSLQEFICMHMRNGQSVRFGYLGSFRPTITTKGVDSEKLFKTSHIKAVRTRFTPGSQLRFEMSPKNPQVKFRQFTVDDSSSDDNSGSGGSTNP